MFHSSPFGHDPMFTLVPIFIFVIFVVVVVSIVTRVAKGMSDWTYNNSQPVQSEAATVVSKRMEVNGTEHRSSTTYYATFELPGAERREFKVTGSEYGLLAEGDAGQLQYQGSRYLGFNRSLVQRERSAEPESSPATDNLVCEYCGAVNAPDARKCAGCGSGKLVPAEPKAEA
jgi:ribosomal protein L40E